MMKIDGGHKEHLVTKNEMKIKKNITSSKHNAMNGRKKK